jgi:hypothetical protein
VGENGHSAAGGLSVHDSVDGAAAGGDDQLASSSMSSDRGHCTRSL